MAHELTSSSSMFFVGQTPWHGLGKAIPSGCISSEEAMRLAECDWTVGTKPLFTEDGTRAPAVAIYHQGTGKILGVGGPRYVPLQNADAFRWFDPFLQEGLCEFETAGCLRGGRTVWVLARIKQTACEIVKGDEVDGFILLSNDHGGFRAIRPGFTPIRVVCANTLAIAEDGDASKLLRVRHQGDVVRTLARVRDAMDLARRAFEATAEQYRALAACAIRDEDLKRYVQIVLNQKPAKPASKTVAAEEPIVGEGSAVDSILAAGDAVEGIGGAANEVLVETEKDRSSRSYEAIAELFESGRGTEIPGVRGTLWGAYNAITEWVAHERGRDATRLEQTWFGAGASINRRALEVATVMAATGGSSSAA